MEPRLKKPLNQVHDALRLKHYFYHIEQSYRCYYTSTRPDHQAACRCHQGKPPL